MSKKEPFSRIVAGTPKTLLKSFRIPFDLWEWYGTEAEIASKANGKRIGRQTLIFAVLRRYMEEVEKLESEKESE